MPKLLGLPAIKSPWESRLSPVKRTATGRKPTVALDEQCLSCTTSSWLIIVREREKAECVDGKRRGWSAWFLRPNEGENFHSKISQLIRLFYIGHSTLIYFNLIQSRLPIRCHKMEKSKNSWTISSSPFSTTWWRSYSEESDSCLSLFNFIILLVFFFYFFFFFCFCNFIIMLVTVIKINYQFHMMIECDLFVARSIVHLLKK